MLWNRDLKPNLPGGRCRQILGEAVPQEVFRKKCSDKKHPNGLKYLHFILRHGAKIIILRAAVGPRAASLRPML